MKKLLTRVSTILLLFALVACRENGGNVVLDNKDETFYDEAVSSELSDYEISRDDNEVLHEIADVECYLALALLKHEAIIEIEVVPIATPELDFISYRIRYESDGYEVIGYVVAPADFTDTIYPVLIFNREGFVQTRMIRCPSELVPLANMGYIVMASQYRGVAGGTGMEQFGGDDVNDVLRLIDISENFNFAQQGGVYMAGASRGGMMTYIASRKDDRIVAAAVWAPASDLIAWYNDVLDMRPIFINLIGGHPEGEWLEEYKRRSAIFWADEVMAPILIMHGRTDPWVDPQHSINMAEALESYGKPHQLIIYPVNGHIMPVSALSYMDEWFRRHPIKVY